MLINRSCYAEPAPPEGLIIMHQNDSFFILWEGTTSGDLSDIFHLVTVTLKNQNEIIQQTKVNPSSESSMNAAVRTPMLDRLII